jgi:hypothetical protein
MKQGFVIALALLAGPAFAVPGGQIDSLPAGQYLCELPGDATGPVGRRQEAESFTILNASTYASPGGRGSYLLTGDRLTMTSGPKNGESFVRKSDNFLRKLDANGRETALRCVRRVVNNT